MNCSFCGEPLESGRHPITESGAYDLTGCQLSFLLRRNSALEAKLEAAQRWIAAVRQCSGDTWECPT